MPDGQSYTTEQWKKILVNASQQPNDPDAQAAMAEARQHLKADIAHQEQVNKLINQREVGEAQDPGMLGQLAGSALHGIATAPKSIVDMATAISSLTTPRTHGMLSTQAGQPREQVPSPTSGQAISAALEPLNFVSGDTRKAFETGAERHPIAAEVGETIGEFAPVVASGISAARSLLPKSAKALRREMLELGVQRAKQGLQRGAQAIERGPAQLERAQLGVEQARAGLERAPMQQSQAAQRLRLLENQVENMPVSNEKQQLQNELLKLRIQELEQRIGVGSAEVAPADVSAIGKRPSTAAETAPDVLRNLTDEELAQLPLGQTPTPGESFGAPGNIERRTENTGRRYTGLERRGGSEFIGTGPESVTPEALAKTKVIGKPEPKITPAGETPKPAVGKAPSITPKKPVTEQKAVTFAKGTKKATKTEVKNLLGEMAKKKPSVIGKVEKPVSVGTVRDAINAGIEGGRNPYAEGSDLGKAFKAGQELKKMGTFADESTINAAAERFARKGK